MRQRNSGVKAFITGGAGFIGSSMVDRLLLGPSNAVTVFDNFSRGENNLRHMLVDNERLQLVPGDLQEYDVILEAMRGHDIVYHFAATPDVARGADETYIDLNNSILATYHVLEAMRHHGIKKLVYLSAAAVYGDAGGSPTSEEFGPLLPVSMYGAGKLSAEALISAFAHQFEITSYIFRLADVVGSRQGHGVPYDLIKQLRADPRQLTMPGDGTKTRSYIHIDDVLNCIFFVLAMTSDRVNVFNVATDDVISLSWIAETVLECLGLSHIPIAYAGGDGGFAGDIPVVRLDLEKIHKLGWFTKFNSQDAMRLAITQVLTRMSESEAAQEAL